MRATRQLALRRSSASPPGAAAISRPPRLLAATPPASRRLLVAPWLPAAGVCALIAIARQAPQAFAPYAEILGATYAAVAAIVLSIAVFQVGRPRYPLTRRRLTLVALGAAIGLGLPLGLLLRPLAAEPTPPLAAALALSCLFPLACTLATRTTDLFALDLLLRRTLTYGLVGASVGLAELTLLLGLNAASPELATIGAAPLALGNVVLLLGAPLLHKRAAAAIKRRLSGPGYGSRRELARFSDALAGAQTAEGVRRALANTMSQTLNPTHHHLYVEDRHGSLAPIARTDPTPVPALPRALLDEMGCGQVLYRYRWDDGRRAEVRALWDGMRFDALVPIFAGGVLHAVLALGPKRSGASYHTEDITFLRAVAALAALGLTNARAFAQLRQMNTTLERTVDERTVAERAANAELQSANTDLAHSLAELRQAYAQLEQNHACLLRAERLATLGRLTAGIAHEVNTPLSAVQNALRILRELGEEYAASVDDPSVQPADHRDIATEIITTARAAADWADKAARFIRGTKTHGRTARDTIAEPFTIRDIVDEARTLLVHRLRVIGCTLAYAEEQPDIRVVGDRSAFAQVMINIVSNALDAYEDARRTDVRVLVSVSCCQERVTVEVRDWAGGIPLQVLPRIFEELFTTKGPGRGTGLGLWISRTIIEKEFGGLLDVMSVPGDGSCFIATIPTVSSVTVRQDAA